MNCALAERLSIVSLVGRRTRLSAERNRTKQRRKFFDEACDWSRQGGFRFPWRFVREYEKLSRQMLCKQILISFWILIKNSRSLTKTKKTRRFPNWNKKNLLTRSRVLTRKISRVLESSGKSWRSFQQPAKKKTFNKLRLRWFFAGKIETIPKPGRMEKVEIYWSIIMKYFVWCMWTQKNKRHYCRWKPEKVVFVISKQNSHRELRSMWTSQYTEREKKDKRKVQEDGKSSNNDDDENVEFSSIGLLCNLCDSVWLRAAGNLRW